MIFFDTSYLVRLYLEENGSDAVRCLAAQDDVAASWHAQPELLLSPVFAPVLDFAAFGVGEAVQALADDFVEDTVDFRRRSGRRPVGGAGECGGGGGIHPCGVRAINPATAQPPGTCHSAKCPAQMCEVSHMRIQPKQGEQQGNADDAIAQEFRPQAYGQDKEE